MSIKLIVGLRNPGATYAPTRHNVGGWLVEALAKHHTVSFKPEKGLHGELALIHLDGQACRLMLPSTYMNHSGLPVRAISQFYRILPTEILIAHDELDLPVGQVKLKTGGGHGGHNGLRDIITQLGLSDFHRLRVGIGHPGHKDLVVDYVLGKPKPTEQPLIEDAMHRAIEVLPTIFSKGMAVAMSLLNQ